MAGLAVMEEDFHPPEVVDDLVFSPEDIAEILESESIAMEEYRAGKTVPHDVA